MQQSESIYQCFFGHGFGETSETYTMELPRIKCDARGPWPCCSIRQQTAWMHQHHQLSVMGNFHKAILTFCDCPGADKFIAFLKEVHANSLLALPVWSGFFLGQSSLIAICAHAHPLASHHRQPLGIMHSFCAFHHRQPFGVMLFFWLAITGSHSGSCYFWPVTVAAFGDLVWGHFI